MSTVAAQDWHAYWQQAGAKGVCELGGTDHPAIAQFWHNFFKSSGYNVISGSDSDSLQLVDVASGNGAVLEYAIQNVAAGRLTPMCIDISPAAVGEVCERWPHVTGLVADAAALPLVEGGIDIVVSQFGIEYAGSKAIIGLLDIVKPGGEIALLIHHKGGAIYRECADNHAALKEVQRIGFLESAIEMFDCAFKVLIGGDRSEYEVASRKLKSSFRAMEGVLQQYGRHVAADTVRKLCQDVDHVHSNLPRFNKSDVENWLRNAILEFSSYAGRMRSMCEAAVDEKEMHSLVDKIKRHGFSVSVAKSLEAEDLHLPLAWSLIARKYGS